MKRIHARTLLQYDTEQLWDILGVYKFILVFDDGGTVETTSREAIYSSYFWDLIRHYPNTPLLARHHVSAVLKGGYLNAKTHINMLRTIYWDVVEAYGLDTPVKRDPLSKLTVDVSNDHYNKLTYRVEEFVVSIDILDFIEIEDAPRVAVQLENIQPTNESIDACYSAIKETIYKDPLYSENGLVKACRSNTVDIKQVLHCVGPVGYPTEVDSFLMPTPILRSFTQTLRSLYNVMAEERSAAKSLFFSEDPLEQAEYFARRLQILCMSVERLHYEDCGSTDYVDWYLKPDQYDSVDGHLIRKGDLEFMEGKYYLDEPTGRLKILRKSDTHLYGTNVKLRSVLTCKHSDKAGVCSVCFGDLASNAPDGINLGHLCAATMTQQTSQSVLSTKHHNASATAEPVQINPIARTYFQNGKDRNAFYLRPEVKSTVKMIISSKDAEGLTDILLTSKFEDLSPNRISAMDTIYMQFNRGADLVTTPVPVSQHTRKAMLSGEFLGHLREFGWETDPTGTFIFDLSTWDTTKPIMKIPEMEYSYAQHSSQIAAMIESSMQDIGDRMKPESPVKTLTELFDLVNAKLSVNLACLEVIIYASMVAGGEDGSYGLSRGSATASLGVANYVIWNRSLGAAYTYESQADVIIDPASFIQGDRPDSPLDVFIAPKEVVEAYQHP